MRTGIFNTSLFMLFLLPILSSTNTAIASADENHGQVYYLDGAGGGSFLSSWTPGVKKGLKQGGVKEDFQEFVWQTHLGVVADQTSSVQYKRDKAKKLAQKIVTYKDNHPDTPVTMIGLSAGTAVTLFTLEALPENYQVDRVILIGSSVDANYDLTRALEHTNDLIIYTSPHDEILSVFVPLTGTSDRKYVGLDIAGLKGFHLPENADAYDRELYTKVKTVPWCEEFKSVSDYGRHTDKTNARFVSQYIAPLVLTASHIRIPSDPFLVWTAEYESMAFVTN